MLLSDFLLFLRLLTPCVHTPSQPLHLQRYRSFLYWFLQIQPVTHIGRHRCIISHPAQLDSVCSLSKSLFSSVLFHFIFLPSLCSAHSLPNAASLPSLLPVLSGFHIFGTLCCQVWSKTFCFWCGTCVITSSLNLRSGTFLFWGKIIEQILFHFAAFIDRHTLSISPTARIFSQHVQ